MRRRRRQTGFTLIELLIALGITTVGVLGLMSLQSVAQRGNRDARNVSEAVGLLQERLEALQVVSYANLPAYAVTENNLAPTPQSAVQRIYTRVTTVNPGVNSATITVTVSWSDLDLVGRTHALRMVEVRTP